MKTIQILNPAAGHGKAKLLNLANDDKIRYTTTGIGDAENYVYKCCLEEPETHFIVCGGDGTINEVVNGIMRANAGNKAIFSVVPTGTGNDFARNYKDEHKKVMIDLIKYNNRYAVNMINIGFDCDVVVKTKLYKKKVPGSMAYILSVINVLMHKLGDEFDITVTDENDNIINYKQECLLTAIANGPYCGGGFKAAPLAELNDGLLDMLIADKVSRSKFIALVGEYRKGTFINKNGVMKKEYAEVLKYIKCKKVKINNIRAICADGEVEEANSVEISVLPKAVCFYS